ncbi:hypothetical protein COO51_02315 [Yersinia enterocolitica]|nr:hypothetical protein COO51_02315 [Yersinia enterocolitica]
MQPGFFLMTNSGFLNRNIRQDKGLSSNGERNRTTRTNRFSGAIKEDVMKVVIMAQSISHSITIN